MSYCPKCGNKVEESMVFCPRCGASLKGTATGQVPPVPPAQPYRRRDEKSEKNEKQEKNQQPEKGEKNEKGERGFVGYLIGGIVLITVGVFAILNLSGSYTSGQSWALMLVIVGAIIIVGAIYVAVLAKRHNPPPP
jgi:hypothetical protein